MTDTNVKIRAKGCNATGITDDLATKLFNSKGNRIMAIVELKVDETHEKADGDRKVDLIITELEPVVADSDVIAQRAEDDIRRIQRALFMNRKIGEDETLPLESNEPVLADVLAASQALVETDAEGTVKGLGLGEDADAAAAESAEQAGEEPTPIFSGKKGRGTTG